MKLTNPFSFELSCDPIYTIATGSLFIIHVNEKEFRENEVGLEFKVKDHDTVSKSDELGIVHVSGKTLCDADGKRMPFKLDCADGSESLLNLRCRPATGYDLKFMDYAAQHKKDPTAGFLSVDKRLDILMKPKSAPSKTLLMKEKDRMEGRFFSYILDKYSCNGQEFLIALVLPSTFFTTQITASKR